MGSRELMPLPFDVSWPAIETALAKHRNLILVAEPGAGKTTRFAPMLVDRAIVSGNSQIAVLEPRRIAARAAALRISEERGWPMKSKVGYSVRFDHQMSDATRVAFYTEGLFLKRLAYNPTLKGIDCVVLDEFHERSRHTDIAISALKELQMLERPDLRIVVMSATIDAEKIAEFLAIDNRPAEIVRVPGRTFPISIRHSSEPLLIATSREWTERIGRLIKSVAIGERIGDILVFLPGAGEIRRVRELLDSDTSFANKFELMELHGSLSLEEQSRVLSRNESSIKPKIVLATNIAETSLTIDGVGTVIDTGLQRVARADRLGFSQLHLERISLASATQRAGRAGRQAAGLCYRMWSKLDENSFQKFDEAELSRVDLTDSILDLYSIGIHDPHSFDWFERPDGSRLKQSLALLTDIGAIDQSLRLTELGTRMYKSGTPVRAARLLAAASTGEISLGPRAELETLAAIIAALLTERDFLLDNQSQRHSPHECDLYYRAVILTERSPSERVDRSTIKIVRRVIDSYLTQNAMPVEEAIANWNESAVAALLLKAFPDRLAKRRREGSPQARMVGAKGIELHTASTVHEAAFFFALKGDAGASRTSSDPMTTLASSISRDLIEKLAGKQISKQTVAVFDEQSLAAYSERVSMYRDLPLDSGAREKLDPNDALELLKSEAIARKSRLFALPPISRLLTRLKYLQRQKDLVNDATIDETLQAAIEETLYGKSSLADLFTEEGGEVLAQNWERTTSGANPQIATALRESAPSHFTAPTGNRFRIEYPENQPPFLEVRLQELFGLAKHPSIAGQPLTFHLLGPNYRPVQVTADLPGFWRGSYAEVRKELRARYPKHSWPENPIEAKPEAKGHRRPR